MTLEFPFAYPQLYKPLFLTLRASFSPFIFGESERSLGVRVYLSFSRFSIPSKFFEWETFFKYENLNFSSTFTCFLNSRHFFTKILNFSFIKLHETNSFTPDCKNIFSSKSHEIHLKIDWNIFLHDPTWKSHHMKPCSLF